MPELPEVETVVQILNNSVVGKTIDFVEIYMDKVLKNCNPEDFKRLLIGEKIIKVLRKGKHIVFLTNNYCVINHLRMEGKFFVTSRRTEYSAGHVLVKFIFQDECELHYHDTRRFGTFHIHPLNDFHENKLLNQIGKEPFDESLTSKEIHEKWSKRRVEIKKLLLEQNLICGIGNIYACEILFDCKLSPFIKGTELTKRNVDEILKSTKIILRKAIKAGGSTVSSFSVGHGISGKFQNQLKVYGKKDSECLDCEKKIEKEVVGGRGTYFCPNCQDV